MRLHLILFLPVILAGGFMLISPKIFVRFLNRLSRSVCSSDTFNEDIVTNRQRMLWQISGLGLIALSLYPIVSMAVSSNPLPTRPAIEDVEIHPIGGPFFAVISAFFLIATINPWYVIRITRLNEHMAEPYRNDPFFPWLLRIGSGFALTHIVISVASRFLGYW